MVRAPGASDTASDAEMAEFRRDLDDMKEHRDE